MTSTRSLGMLAGLLGLVVLLLSVFVLTRAPRSPAAPDVDSQAALLAELREMRRVHAESVQTLGRVESLLAEYLRAPTAASGTADRDPVNAVPAPESIATGWTTPTRWRISNARCRPIPRENPSWPPRSRSSRRC